MSIQGKSVTVRSLYRIPVLMAAAPLLVPTPSPAANNTGVAAFSCQVAQDACTMDGGTTTCSTEGAVCIVGREEEPQNFIRVCLSSAGATMTVTMNDANSIWNCACW